MPLQAASFYSTPLPALQTSLGVLFKVHMHWFSPHNRGQQMPGCRQFQQQHSEIPATQPCCHAQSRTPSSSSLTATESRREGSRVLGLCSRLPGPLLKVTSCNRACKTAPTAKTKCESRRLEPATPTTTPLCDLSLCARSAHSAPHSAHSAHSAPPLRASRSPGLFL